MINKESPKGEFNWAVKGRTGAAVHTQATITPCGGTLRDIESRVREDKLILNIIPFWKTFLTRKMSTIFKSGMYSNF